MSNLVKRNLRSQKSIDNVKKTKLERLGTQELQIKLSKKIKKQDTFTDQIQNLTSTYEFDDSKFNELIENFSMQQKKQSLVEKQISKRNMKQEKIRRQATIELKQKLKGKQDKEQALYMEVEQLTEINTFDEQEFYELSQKIQQLQRKQLKLQNEIKIRNQRKNESQMIQQQKSFEEDFDQQMQKYRISRGCLNQQQHSDGNQRPSIIRQDSLTRLQNKFKKPSQQAKQLTPSIFPLMLAENFKQDFRPNWLMSEKLDGVRAFWNGTDFYSRNNNVFIAPQWFKDKMPWFCLDGELWMGRKQFKQTISCVKKKVPVDQEWEKIQYMVFDAPHQSFSFDQRINFAKDYFRINSFHKLKFVEQTVCKDMQQMNDELKRIESLQGEGLMLRNPLSLYENKRSKQLLKVKSMHDDEAVVIKHVLGTGRCANMMGAIICKNEFGIVFKIGSGFNDHQRKNPPKIGSKITFKYQEKMPSGKYRFPVFLREYTSQ